MDDRRTAHGMTDAELDRELGRALRVDPSPEFVARVRSRIAEEPAPSRWTFGRWQLVAVAAVAASLLIAVVVHRRANPPIARDQAVLSARPIGAGAIAALQEHEPVRRTEREPLEPMEREPFGRMEREGFSRASAAPEVLIDPREAQALRAVIARVRTGALDLSPVLMATKPEAMDLPPITDIVIEPIAIDPLAPDTGAQGVRQ
jgi:hypothetical protein